MGRQRAYRDYLRMVGIEPWTKTVVVNNWCHKGEWPEEAKLYRYDGPHN
jgi:ribulose bisphosphate carboxylase small subunit